MEELKYKNILLPLDNSEYSDYAMEAALTIAGADGARVTGCHVYAARLHESRFMDMEEGLPPQYRSESVLKRQREVHGDLIEKGLGTVADSYLSRFEAAAGKKGVRTARRNLEGKNWVELLKEARREPPPGESLDGGYDLVVMGGLGKGAVETSLIGGVSERVARGVTKDVLLVKTPSFGGTVVACIDGSPSSYGALKSAIAIASVFGGRVEAVAVFDPYFHQVAFRNIAGALTEEARTIFKFEEQEKLHDEIIDSGLAKLYQSYLDTACRVAREQGVEIKTTLLAGKAFNEIIKHVSNADAPDVSFVVLGRFGMHRVPESGMGTTAENVLRAAPTNVLISTEELGVHETKEGEGGGGGGGATFNWTDAALMRLERIPQLVRGMARKAVEEHAAEAGTNEITEELMDEVRKRFGM